MDLGGLEREPDHLPGNSVWVGSRVQVGVLERLGDRSAGLGIVSQLRDLGRVDVLVQGAVQVVVDGDAGREVELRIERAGAVPGLHGRGAGEFVHVGGTGAWAVEALLDAVTGRPHGGKSQIHFGDDAGHVEAGGVCTTSTSVWKRVLVGGWSRLVGTYIAHSHVPWWEDSSRCVSNHLGSRDNCHEHQPGRRWHLRPRQRQQRQQKAALWRALWIRKSEFGSLLGREERIETR